jgi:hypothetical protein
MIKKIMVMVLCIVIAFPFFGCDLFKGPKMYSINVKILPEFQQKFESREFSKEDFEWDNVRLIIYQEWADRVNGSFGLVTLHLNDAKEEEALDALEHIKTLNFVTSAEIIEEEFALDKVGINIKTEFQQQYDNREFSIEDFEWDNMASIEYVDSWVGGIVDSNLNPVSITNSFLEIHLKRPGRNSVLDAIEHFKTLNFVDDADVTYNSGIN